MLIVREVRFSKIEDEDYLDEQQGRIREVRNSHKWGAGLGAAGGGLMGASTGLAIGGGSTKGLGIGAAVGAGIGAGLGYVAGKKQKKSVTEDAERKIKRYRGASKEDRKYLRRKYEKEKEEALRNREAAARETMAYNSFRW